MTPINRVCDLDRAEVVTETDRFALEPADGGRCWRTAGVELETAPAADGLRVTLSAPGHAVKRVGLHWPGEAGSTWRFLGDHWERGYGDLEWRAMVPHRVMPWYFLAFDGARTHAWGVKTGAGAICSWRVDPKGVSLTLDVRCGGRGVELGKRTLPAATVVYREGAADVSPFGAARSLCSALCDRPRLPAAPVYGGNNWYYAYGRSSHEQILEDTRLIASLAPAGANRPFMVIDDGWQVAHEPPYNGGPWHAGNPRFGDMPGLAAAMRDVGVRPGIWFRPLWTRDKVPSQWHFDAGRFGGQQSPPPLDPSVLEVRERVAADVRRMVEWGYELIKHDFSSFDLTGRWGFGMATEMTADGWSFADRRRTTAEVMLDLYRTLREAAGNAVIIGCNTVGHLAAGLVELQRTGDDTSGHEWARTRKMGVNTLAFRMAQHETFFAADADCVGLTGHVPWALNRQWLELLAASGTPLFVSAAPDAVGPEQRAALKRAFARACRRQPPGEPLDWLQTTCPSEWRFDGERVQFDWFDAPDKPAS